MLSELVDKFADFVQQIIAVLGAPGITFIALLENLFPPTPSEILYPLAGKMAANGQISLFAIVTGGVAGSLGGALFYYGLGYQLGESRVRTLVERYGTIPIGAWHVRFISTSDYDRQPTALSQVWYDPCFYCPPHAAHSWHCFDTGWRGSHESGVVYRIYDAGRSPLDRPSVDPGLVAGRSLAACTGLDGHL